jgi:hypothetical protein
MPDVHSGGSQIAQVVCDDPSGTGLNWDTDSSHDAHHGFVSYDQAGGVYYTADYNYAGSDSWTTIVSDNEGGSVTVNFTVTVTNAAPTCDPNFFTPRRVKRDIATSIDLAPQCIDPDGDVLVFSRSSNPAAGTLSAGPSSTLTYTPTAGYTGPDSFTYVAKDPANGTSAVTTFYLDVVDSVVPTCTTQPTVTLRPGQSRQVQMSCSDPNNATITYKIVSGPTMGTLSPSGDTNNAIRQYTAGSAAGADSYTYRATSSGGASVTYTQSISIDPSANQTPSCFSNSGLPQAVSAGRSRVLNISSACSDPDSDPLTFTAFTPAPQHGGVNSYGGQLVYTPDQGYSGSDTIPYTADDGHGGVVHGTFSVTVSSGGANAAPTCDPVTRTTPSATTVTISLACTDSNGDFVTLSVVDPPDPAKGSLGPVDQGSRTVDFTPAAGFSGEVTFTFAGSDGLAASAPQTATVTVQPAPAGGGGGADPGSGSGSDPGSGTGSGGGSDGGASPAPAASSDNAAPSAPAGAPATADTTRPGMALGALPKLKLGQLLKKGLVVRLTLTEGAKVSANLVLAKKLAKKLKLGSRDIVVGSLTRASGAGPLALVVRLTPKAKKAFAKARSLQLKLSLAATDAAGNQSTASKPLSIRR